MMHRSAERHLIEATEHVWLALAAIRPEPTSLSSLELGAEQQPVTAVLQIAGSWHGAIVLQCSSQLARRAASAMFEPPPLDIADTELYDALGELANVTAGTLKRSLGVSGQTSLPTVIRGRDYGLQIPGARLVGEVAFRCDGEPLTVRLLERDPHRVT